MTNYRPTIVNALLGILVINLLGLIFIWATPRIETVTVEVPGPTVEVETFITPEACLNALDIAQTIMAADNETILQILDAYLDFPEETLQDFGARVEKIIENSPLTYADNLENYIPQATECYNNETLAPDEPAQGA